MAELKQFNAFIKPEETTEAAKLLAKIQSTPLTLDNQRLIAQEVNSMMKVLDAQIESQLMVYAQTFDEFKKLNDDPSIKQSILTSNKKIVPYNLYFTLTQILGIMRTTLSWIVYQNLIRGEMNNKIVGLLEDVEGLKIQRESLSETRKMIEKYNEHNMNLMSLMKQSIDENFKQVLIQIHNENKQDRKENTAMMLEYFSSNSLQFIDLVKEIGRSSVVTRQVADQFEARTRAQVKELKEDVKIKIEPKLFELKTPPAPLIPTDDAVMEKLKDDFRPAKNEVKEDFEMQFDEVAKTEF